MKTKKPKPTHESLVAAFRDKLKQARSAPERNVAERPRETVDAATWYTVSREVDFAKPCILIGSRLLSQMRNLGLPEQPRTQKLCLEWHEGDFRA